jgi:ribonuclease P protein component
LTGREEPAATGTTVVRLRRRSEFLAAARGVRVNREPFTLQALARAEPERAASVGIGLTVTRMIGNAVTRNRARRRLREALRLLLPGPARPGTDYVVVARPAALTRPFPELHSDLAGAFAQIARRRSAR